MQHDLIDRKQLLDRINNRLSRPLSLVCAPAGYGKSTLVSGWLEGCDLPVAWLSISESENDLHLFLSYFLAAVQTIFTDVGKEIQTLLKRQELPSIPILAGRLINSLDKINTSFILTIDDHHVVQNNATHELLLRYRLCAYPSLPLAPFLVNSHSLIITPSVPLIWTPHPVSDA